MRSSSFVSLLAIAALLSGCGGDGSSPAGPIGGAPTPGTPSPAPSSAACSLASRQQWALQQLQEWYLFPELLASDVNPSNYSTLDAYIDALVAPARAQSRDRYFTYVTSIAEENAYYAQGETAGFGFRLTYDEATRRVYVIEAFEGAPALAAGIDRGSEIVGISDTQNGYRTVASLFLQGGAYAVSEALGPSTVGTTRTLRIRQIGGAEQDVTIIKADYELQPVSPRYGSKIISDGGRQYGYVNLRTFVDTADPALRQAILSFRQQGITEIVVDLRYNGGGLVRIAELFSDLLNSERTNQVQSYTTFRSSKSSNNETTNFTYRAEAIPATKIAFIGSGATASASELVMNAQLPYLPNQVVLIGADTYGKPVGQIGIDRSACDDRLRVVAFRIENANRQGDYYNGLRGRFPAFCPAVDDTRWQLGDPREETLSTAIDYLAGRRTCATTTTSVQQQSAAPRREPLLAIHPNAAQFDMPGLF